MCDIPKKKKEKNKKRYIANKERINAKRKGAKNERTNEATAQADTTLETSVDPVIGGIVPSAVLPPCAKCNMCAGHACRCCGDGGMKQYLPANDRADRIRDNPIYGPSYTAFAAIIKRMKAFRTRPACDIATAAKRIRATCAPDSINVILIAEVEQVANEFQKQAQELISILQTIGAPTHPQPAKSTPAIEATTQRSPRPAGATKPAENTPEQNPGGC